MCNTSKTSNFGLSPEDLTKFWQRNCKVLRKWVEVRTISRRNVFPMWFAKLDKNYLLIDICLRFQTEWRSLSGKWSSSKRKRTVLKVYQVLRKRVKLTRQRWWLLVVTRNLVTSPSIMIWKASNASGAINNDTWTMLKNVPKLRRKTCKRRLK